CYRRYNPQANSDAATALLMLLDKAVWARFTVPKMCDYRDGFAPLRKSRLIQAFLAHNNLKRENNSNVKRSSLLGWIIQTCQRSPIILVKEIAITSLWTL